jgi:NTP pyrophosphatase (non-canonical NTP hydrolase)
MNELKNLIKKIIKFRDDRDWKQFHNAKDISISLVLEATELMEHFQWKKVEELDDYIKKNKDKIEEELADVLYWVLLLSHDLKIDLKKVLEKKIKINEKKYPVEKSKGKYNKYTEL